ncbi:MAG: RNase adaptor protein RapZ [Actinobacteria bacterium RBG_19FT_COMBO_54_7]|uniref:RNase adaptor protein RapZ n=1 Tax=Candidatus Solincola sediminis TaxID=1797199 RepID=A0A1F2WGK7_9ACTN|nr:MAG: RNase adaptor protein RapZ [Candidatus Solincola sediminis]OFW56248.1 MAG: RNase adaptor protein RapZ [Candidatus Solincola sediminis]OFW70778.1 MAG: RNase adaptor protein RapZ [Actinobacteria bacterium RBG_19FT_COMBO_54_7]
MLVKRILEVSRLEISIITGLSGAGRSIAIKSLEDLGYFCVDNLPPSLLLKMVELCSQGDNKIDHLAAVIDVRGGEFFDDLNESLQEMDRGQIPYRIIFLEADDESLLRRFKETRRAHPMPSDGGISESITRERQVLRTLRGRADIVIDTSKTNVHQLREQLMEQYRSQGVMVPLEISMVSFGYKYGIPLDADMVLDLRFLPNPFWVDSLRNRDGRDDEVKKYVLGHEECKEYLDKVESLLEFLKDKFIREGRRYMTVAVGCTGGQHRSVAVAEELAYRLSANDWWVKVRHRDAHRR